MDYNDGFAAKFGGSPAKDVTRGLVGYWNFDKGVGQTANDASDSNNDGTLTNMQNEDWVQGKPGNAGALDFDGVEDYVDTGSDIQTFDHISVSAWINTDSLTANQNIVGHRNSGNGWVLRCMGATAGDPLEFTIFGVVDPDSASSGINADTWYHVAVTYDRTNIRFYINGVLLSSHAQTAPIGDSIQDVFIGALNNPLASCFFDGKIDEVRIYNRASSAA